MVPHTKAFLSYRKLSQAHINFVVLVCHAVPAFRADLALPQITCSYPPDHFKAERNPKSEVASYVSKYQDDLARSTLVTVFSYFEAYIKDALTEIVEFHGGKKNFKQKSLERTARFIAQLPPALKAHKRKLQDNHSASKKEKYQKHGRILDKEGFKFPTDLFAHYGVSRLLEKLDEKKGMRAWEIPFIVEECLLFPISKSQVEDFEAMRGMRNKITHGRSHPISLKESLRKASLLHSLAAEIDGHIAEHFLVIQPA